MDEAALSVIAKKLYAGSKLEHSVPLTGGVSANVYRLDLKNKRRHPDQRGATRTRLVSLGSSSRFRI